MQNKLFILLVGVAAVVGTAIFMVAGAMASDPPPHTDPTCDPTELENYECSFDTNEYFEVRIIKPFPVYDIANDESTYRWLITELNSPGGARHFNLIINQLFGGKIVVEQADGLDCTGSGFGSSRFAKYLTWNCFYNWNNREGWGDQFELSLTLEGQHGSAPNDWFILAGDRAGNIANGIILAPGTLPPDAIAKTTLKFTATDPSGQQYLIEIKKDTLGNILEIMRTPPGGEPEPITDTGIPWAQVQFSVEGGPWEGVEFINNDTTSKTGNESTCGYWYRGVFWNFCF